MSSGLWEAFPHLHGVVATWCAAKSMRVGVVGLYSNSVAVSFM
jgi:hypothetical protein